MPPSPLPYHPTGVCFVDAQHGWVLGQTDGYGSVLLHTIDGGHTWDFQHADTWQPITSISFSDAANGWAVGVARRLAHDRRRPDVDVGLARPGRLRHDRLQDDRRSRGTVLVSGTDNSLNPLMVRSGDDGATWQAVASPPKFVAPPSFTSSTEGWAIAVDWTYNGLVHTTDGGLTWQTQYGPLFTTPVTTAICR